MERYVGEYQKEPGHQTRDTASPVDNVRSPEYRMAETARHLPAIAALEAAIPDAAALVFACLGIVLALHGRPALRARALDFGLDWPFVVAGRFRPSASWLERELSRERSSALNRPELLQRAQTSCCRYRIWVIWGRRLGIWPDFKLTRVRQTQRQLMTCLVSED